MTKEITKAKILQEIEDKFKLRELVPSRFEFSETVVPTYEISSHVKEHIADYATKSITSADGFGFFVVPQTERWFLSRYVVVFESGAYTIAGVYIRRIKELNPSIMYLDLTAAQNVSYMNDLPKAVALDPGDALWIYVDGYTSTGNARLYIDYIRERLR